VAQIVCAIGVPHTPAYPSLVEREGPDCEVARLYRAVRENLESVQPDVIVIFDSDHINTFFFNNWPTFAIGTAPKILAPNDDNSALPKRIVAGHEALGNHLYSCGVAGGFDLSLTQHFGVDHSVLVPLHFLTPGMNVPIVPIFINGLAPPLPAARRCFALGEIVRAAIERWPDDARVAVIASGSFSLEVAGPRMAPGKNSGIPDMEWTKRVVKLLSQAKIDDLLEETTADQMAKAGNVGGEILNWIAMLGVLGSRRPAFVQQQTDEGHAYGAWRWD
jgi:gallate dioxygenase